MSFLDDRSGMIARFHSVELVYVCVNPLHSVQRQVCGHNGGVLQITNAGMMSLRIALWFTAVNDFKQSISTRTIGVRQCSDVWKLSGHRTSAPH
jgi:hypothetical protein